MSNRISIYNIYNKSDMLYTTCPIVHTRRKEVIDMEDEIERELLNLQISFAFVCKGQLKDFYVVKNYLESLEGIKLVYMTKDMGKLYIVRGEENGK